MTRYVLSLVIDTRGDPSSVDDVEDEVYNACNEIAENRAAWFVDIIDGPQEAPL